MYILDFQLLGVIDLLLPPQCTRDYMNEWVRGMCPISGTMLVSSRADILVPDTRAVKWMGSISEIPIGTGV